MALVAATRKQKDPAAATKKLKVLVAVTKKLRVLVVAIRKLATKTLKANVAKANVVDRSKSNYNPRFSLS